MKIPEDYRIRFLAVLILLFMFHQGSGQLKMVPVTPPEALSVNNFHARIQEVDTLSLPVWDDFSYGGGMPDTTIWMNSAGVHINYSSGINPPTIGVATFDGASSFAGIYDSDPLVIGYADSLVSKPINLGALGPSEINSVYLSFFWEFYGHPDIPEEEDSLRLLFRNQQSQWEVIDVFDRDRAISNDTFQQVIYKVEARFLHPGFQFKFENKARLSGPYDSWHIDYIYLDKGRSLTDNAYLDRAITGLPDYIFNGYAAMPMDQFLVNPGKYLQPSTFDIYNLDAILQPIEYTAILRNTQDPDQIIDTLDFNTEVNPPLQGFERRRLYTRTPDINSWNSLLDSMYITLETYISSGDSISDTGINYRVNDTISYDFVLDNYYAYDDGTAEFGIGMEQLDAQLAYMFVVEEPDVVNRVDIHFPNIGRLQAGTAFDLQIWRRLTDNPDDLIYERPDLAIEPISDFNQFQTIRISDTFVADTFYIGFQQKTNEFLAVGFDKQHDTAERIFFNIFGDWQPSQDIRGSLMIRPYFGDSDPVALEEKSIRSMHIYPNPTEGMVRIEGRIEHVTVYNIMGKRLIHLEGPLRNPELDLTPFQEGVYLLRGNGERGAFSFKIMKKR